MLFNIIGFFSWQFWFFIILITILIFWLIWGGKYEYEFIGINDMINDQVEKLQSKKFNFNTFNIPVEPNENIFEATNVIKSNKGEDIVAEVLEQILDSSVQRNIRPNFLRNHETGKNMELDCYNEEYSIAVEYNGVQHYKFPSVFYKTEEEFMNQVYRDRLKLQLCDESGVYLISIPYWVDMYGSEEQHIKEKNGRKKINFVSREVRYQRIYDYLYEKIGEYFQIIFSQKENDTSESNTDQWIEYTDN